MFDFDLFRRIKNKRLLTLIGRYLPAGVLVEGVLQPTEVGSPQGGPLSPLLSNILLDDLDKELERRGLPFVRPADEFEYLGFSFVGSRASVNVSPKALKKFKRRVVTITGRSRGVSMERRLGGLRRYVRGWMGYFGVASQLKLFARLDGWIRCRVRCCYWKQWKRPKTRRRRLIALGVPRRQAIRHARSRRGPWHMSKTIASGVGLTNAYLAEQGVLSLKSLWAELAHLR